MLDFAGGTVVHMSAGFAALAGAIFLGKRNRITSYNVCYTKLLRFNYDISINMANDRLKNENDIHIKELEFGKKTKDKPFMKVPVRLALYVMKDGNDNININMPVSGSTSDPKFKLGKIIWGAFLNVLSKAALSPFKAMSGLVGTDPET